MSLNFVAQSKALNLFWLEIMKEHAIFIYAGLPHQQGDLLAEAKRFEILYKNEHDDWKSSQPTLEFAKTANSNAIRITEEYLRFKLRLLHLQKTCQLGGSLFPLQIDHIAREAQEYLTLLKTLNAWSESGPPAEMANLFDKELFWLHILGEHASFIAHLLDPSEQPMIRTAQTFAHDYPALLSSAHNLAGFDPAAVSAFTAQVIAETTQLRDWKAQAAELRRECRLMAIVPTLFFEHVTREANYFLAILG